MSELALAEIAERIIPGLEATVALAELRAELEGAYGRALIYEIVIPADGSPWLERRAAMCSRYLRERRLGALGGPAVRIALWRGDSLYLLTGHAFFGLEAARRGVSLEALERELKALVDVS